MPSLLETVTSVLVTNPKYTFSGGNATTYFNAEPSNTNVAVTASLRFPMLYNNTLSSSGSLYPLELAPFRYILPDLILVIC